MSGILNSIFGSSEPEPRQPSPEGSILPLPSTLISPCLLFISRVLFIRMQVNCYYWYICVLFWISSFYQIIFLLSFQATAAPLVNYFHLFSLIELMKMQKREMNRSKRDIEREIRALDRQEAKVIQECKQLAKKVPLNSFIDFIKLLLMSFTFGWNIEYRHVGSE